MSAKRISKREIEGYLWGAATLLRGAIDAGEYKNYIFPLLFLKRLSDVYDEEYEIALEHSGNDEDFARLPEQHRFEVPAGARWRDIRAAHNEVGRAIHQAMDAVVRSNPRLEGVFGDAQWTNTNILTNSTLRNLVEHFSMFDLRVANLPEDELGEAYEYLIKKFADDSGHTAQEFYTNRTVVHLMTDLLGVESGESVYDPTCGTGGMLLSAAKHLQSQGLEHRNLRLYGQEINTTTSAIAKMNLFLHGIEDFEIARADTLEEPQFIENGRLRTFDVVLANPPYSISQWNRSKWESDPWGRNDFGTPPQGRADYAFFQHITKSMDPETGRCAILFPHGILFRKEEYAIRRAMVEADLIDTVIGLGPNLFYNAPMESCIVICRSKKTSARREKIQFIDAVAEVTKQGAQSYVLEHNRDKILSAYRSEDDVDHFARLVPLDEIARANFDLTVHRYVERETATVGISIESAVAGFRDAHRELKMAMAQATEMLGGTK